MTGVLVWVAVGALGGVGALARFAVDAAVTSRVGGRFPAGTFVINISGSALLGLLIGLALDGRALLLAGTALLGSYTTFSTWMFETHRSGEDGQTGVMAVNVVASLVLGLAAAAAGRWVGGGA